MFKKIAMLILLISITLLGKDELEIKINSGKKTDIEVLLMKKGANKQENYIKKYHIKNGDTLNQLSKKLKVKMNDLIKLNHIENKDLIVAGKYLKYEEEGEETDEI